MKLFVAYRNNSLFSRFVPELLEGLEIEKTFIIPAGTSLQDVKGELTAACSNLESTHFLTDSTCRPYNIGRVIKQNLSSKVEIKLDSLFEHEVYIWTEGHNSSENIVWFTEHVSMGNEIKRIVIVRDCICDHGFGRSEEDVVIWISEQLANRFSVQPEVVKTLDEAMPFLDESETIIVVDRHAGLKDLMKVDGEHGYHSLDNWRYKSMLLTLPFETCAEQLISRGAFEHSFNIDRMRESIKEQLKRDY